MKENNNSAAPTVSVEPCALSVGALRARSQLKYFSASEFLRCTPSCSIDEVDLSFLNRLDLARDYAGVPFVININFYITIF